MQVPFLNLLSSRHDRITIPTTYDHLSDEESLEKKPSSQTTTSPRPHHILTTTLLVIIIILLLTILLLRPHHPISSIPSPVPIPDCTSPALFPVILPLPLWKSSRKLTSIPSSSNRKKKSLENHTFSHTNPHGNMAQPHLNSGPPFSLPVVSFSSTIRRNTICQRASTPPLWKRRSLA